jgi:hypothetical protein
MVQREGRAKIDILKSRRKNEGNEWYKKEE